MNKICVTYEENNQPRPFHQRKCGIVLERELTSNDVAITEAMAELEDRRKPLDNTFNELVKNHEVQAVIRRKLDELRLR